MDDIIAPDVPSGPDRILEGLNDAQREAVATVSGPLAIVAGAGSGKTRVVSHRAAYAVATGVVDERQILLVTFTDKAAREMAERVRGLGLGRVTARTFHSAALAQLRYFWPLRHDDEPLPDVMGDKWRIVSPLVRALPGGYKFKPTKDILDEIEWAKSRRISPAAYESQVGERTPPIPAELLARLFRDYERAKTRRGLIDFDDILSLTVDLLEDDEEAAFAVRSRYAWFTVDEFQDTTPLQARLLDLWLGERRDLCVVGDEDQTIYTFAGATPEHLLDFASRYPGAKVIPLLENYRSSPQVIALANKLLASTGRQKQLLATRPDGPEPTIRSFADGRAEETAIVARVRELLAAGVAGHEIAVLFRLNAQTAAFEAAFTRAAIGYQVRGQRFFERREVKAAARLLDRVSDELEGDALVDAVRKLWADQLGFDPDEAPDGREARERHAALSTLLSIVSESASDADAADVATELERRALSEREGDADGVELLTLHRAKGLEWEAVFIPSLEEGMLPVAQAKDHGEALAEERRLLYVGITRARTQLALSWAQQRTSATGKLQPHTMSRFLRSLGALEPKVPTVRVARTPAERGMARASLNDEDAEVFDALRAWRVERAREEKVSPFIVAYDTVLAEIAERRPRNESELLAIPGIGPGKVAKYGADILGIIEE
ncbi:MAG: ATP-dependent helicase [Chloroflexota bacterium]